MTIRSAIVFASVGILHVATALSLSAVQSTQTNTRDAGTAPERRVSNIRSGFLAFFSNRNAKFAEQVGTGSGIHPGVEISAWQPSFLGLPADVGIYGRMLGGHFSIDPGHPPELDQAVGAVVNADVELYAGERVLHARVGLGFRSFSGAVRTIDWSFVRLGARSQFDFGDRFEVTIGAAFYVGVDGGAGGSGREAETRLSYFPPCGDSADIPSWLCRRSFGILAYRFEQFTARASPTAGGNRPEEIASVVIGLGFRT